MFVARTGCSFDRIKTSSMNWAKLPRVLLDVADKYYLIAGIAFLVFYIILGKKISWKKIQPKYPRGKDYGREIFFSTFSILLFAMPPMLLLQNDHLRPHTT